MASEMAHSRAGHGLVPSSFSFRAARIVAAKKDSVFPRLIHLSPPAETGSQDKTLLASPATESTSYWTAVGGSCKRWETRGGTSCRCNSLNTDGKPKPKSRPANSEGAIPEGQSGEIPRRKESAKYRGTW